MVLKFENGYVLLEDNKCSGNAIEQRIYWSNWFSNGSKNGRERFGVHKTTDLGNIHCLEMVPKLCV